MIMLAAPALAGFAKRVNLTKSVKSLLFVLYSRNPADLVQFTGLRLTDPHEFMFAIV